MTATDTEAMSALHELLDERQRYQGWLATLEGRRNSTPPHVYERVQRDYTGRLDRVMQDLAERAGQLAGTIESMTAELAKLRQRESDRTDERHEAELRAAVGEFSPEEWERRRTEVDGDIEQIAAERRTLDDELKELQRIVALTGAVDAMSNAASPASPASPASAVAAGAGSDAAAEATVIPASQEAPVHAESGQSIEDFVAEWHAPQVRTGLAGLSGLAGLGTSRGDEPLPDTSDLEDQIIPAAPMGGNPVGAAGADYGIANGVAGASGGVAPTRTPPPVPAPVGDARRDTDKTLKCPECGAMNYATEWYCERCGGELSTF